MKKKLCSISVIFVVLIINPLYGASMQNQELVDFAYISFANSLLFSIEKTLAGEDKSAAADPGGMILLLGEIDSDHARELLIDLLDLYIGSATSEALYYSIVKHGKTIERQLLLKLESPISGRLIKMGKEKGYKIDLLSTNERNERIKWLLDIIGSGKKLDYTL